MPILPADANKNLALFVQLKLAQLKAMKENFILAHTDLAVTDPVRVKENDRVGKNQGDLSAKTEEVVQNFIQAGYPAEMIDLLRQAEAPMDDASKKILATQNVAAIPPQEKALNLIVEVEKFFHKVMADPQSKSPPPPASPNDPFKDKQQHEMKKRSETAAGQLEQLAKNQTWPTVAKDVNQPTTSPESGLFVGCPAQHGKARCPRPTRLAQKFTGRSGQSCRPAAIRQRATKPGLQDSPGVLPVPPHGADSPNGQNRHR